MEPVHGFLLLAIVVATTLACGPKAARRSTATLCNSWVACTTFVAMTGNYTPWAWFWAVDFLCAAALTIQPIARWQRWLSYTYMGQMGFHAAYAITGGDPLRYLYGLDILFAVQIFIMLLWTGGHGLYRLCRAYHWRPAWVHQVLGWTAR